MQLELGTVLTMISVFAAVYFASKSNDRQNDAKVSQQAAQMGSINQKLDNIADDTREIKRETADVKKNVSDLSQRVVIVEQSAKSAHHRIDGMEDDSTRFFGRRRKRGY